VHFERLTAQPLPERWRLFRLLAFGRLAEIAGAAGDPRGAIDLLERGLEFYQDRDLVRHVMRARRRWYEMGQPGRLAGKPLDASVAPARLGEDR
jgi:hypothetical protein